MISPWGKATKYSRETDKVNIEYIEQILPLTKNKRIEPGLVKFMLNHSKQTAIKSFRLRTFDAQEDMKMRICCKIK